MDRRFACTTLGSIVGVKIEDPIEDKLTEVTKNDTIGKLITAGLGAACAFLGEEVILKRTKAPLEVADFVEGVGLGLIVKAIDKLLKFRKIGGATPTSVYVTVPVTAAETWRKRKTVLM